MLSDLALWVLAVDSPRPKQQGWRQTQVSRDVPEIREGPRGKPPAEVLRKAVGDGMGWRVEVLPRVVVPTEGEQPPPVAASPC